MSLRHPVWISLLTRMSHVTHIVTHMKESCHAFQMGHVTHIDESCHTHEWVISHIWVMSRLPNGSCHTHRWACHTHEWVISHIWVMSRITSFKRMSHVTLANGSCHAHGWVMSHFWMSHVIHMNESCHAYEWVMSYIWMSHGAHMNESCHTYDGTRARQVRKWGSLKKFSKNLYYGVATISRLLKIVGLFCKRAL